MGVQGVLVAKQSSGPRASSATSSRCLATRPIAHQTITLCYEGIVFVESKDLVCHWLISCQLFIWGFYQQQNQNVTNWYPCH
jgi:hypothetical protein